MVDVGLQGLNSAPQTSQCLSNIEAVYYHGKVTVNTSAWLFPCILEPPFDFFSDFLAVFRVGVALETELMLAYR